MAKLLHTLRRRCPLAFGVLLLGTVGCAFPNGTTQGVPLLGNFNRPFVPTPMPERGGLGPDTPAYDSGARIGVSVPDMPVNHENSNGFMSLPQLTSPSILSGARMPFSTQDTVVQNRHMPQMGARLMSTGNNANRLPVVPTNFVGQPQTTPHAVAARAPDPVTMLTSGSAIEAPKPESDVKSVKYQTLREIARVQTPEEGQEVLTQMGASSIKMEQASEGGDWVFVCIVGQKQYEARSPDKLQAMRAVIETIQSEK
jgi:hypothetical protein